MKTMEEKAKAYDEVLKKVKDLISRCKNDTDRRTMIYRVEDIESILPELAESEDERIKKALITFFQRFPYTNLYDAGLNAKEAIAWLEKQGEQIDLANKEYWRGYREGKKEILDKYAEIEKQGQDILEDAILDGNEDGLIAETIRYKHEKQAEQKLDKVKPKFKVGDWCIDNDDGTIFQIVKVLDNTYTYKTNEGNEYSCTHYSLENVAHLWTIKDAKKGDFLATEDNKNFTIPFVAIFKERGLDFFNSYCFIGFDGNFYEGEEGHSTENVHPATKEQRDLLFQKMNEAGYAWDVEKRELKKINSYCQENCKGFQETGKCFADGECKAKREAKQKSVIWSEEDEDHVNSLLKRLKGLCRKEFTTTRFAINEDEDWLKSLRGRVQPKQEWSEEDSYYRNHIIQIIEEINNAPLKRGEDWEAYINWLKSLRPQKCLIPSEEEIEKAAQEWDSKANFNPFYMTMENGKPTGVKQSITTHKESFKAGVNWILKSLKRWKPSDEQMEALWCNCSDGSVLISLYNDLKKLKDS